jgi:flagellar basal-body rod modification protein FlgD
MSPTVPAAGNSAASTATGAASGTAGVASSTVTKNEFLQLLVAQIKNQDPLNPADGTQFLSQLAQFQQLEQSMNTGQDIAAMRQDMDSIVRANGGGTTTQS